MPLTEYQRVVRMHLIRLFARVDFYTETCIVDYRERDFIIELSMQHGYCPVFGSVLGGYCTFNGIKIFNPC